MSSGDDGSQTTWIFREEDPSGRGQAVDIDDIDLQALAEEVVVLLRQELRLERERQGWHRIR